RGLFTRIGKFLRGGGGPPAEAPFTLVNGPTPRGAHARRPAPAPGKTVAGGASCHAVPPPAPCLPSARSARPERYTGYNALAVRRIEVFRSPAPIHKAADGPSGRGASGKTLPREFAHSFPARTRLQLSLRSAGLVHTGSVAPAHTA